MANNNAFSSQGSTQAPNLGSWLKIGQAIPNVKPAVNYNLQGVPNQKSTAPFPGANSPAVMQQGFLPPQHSAPSTPVKSMTTADGTTTTYHAPVTKTTGTTSSGLLGATASATPATPVPQTQAQPIPTAGITPQPQTSQPNAPYQAGPDLASKLTVGLANFGTSPAYTQAMGEYQKVAKQLEDLKAEEAGQTRAINQSGTWTNRALGEQGQANIANAAKEQALGQQLSSLGAVVGQANAQQGLQQGALTSAEGMAAPQLGAFGQGYYQPLNPQGGAAGMYGGGPGAVSNVQSIKDYTTKINDINSQSDAVNNNFSRAANYATTAGLPDNSAIVAGIKNKFAGTVQGDAAIAGFNQVIGQINQQAQALGFAPVDANSVTPAQLKQIQTAVANKLQVDKANYTSELNKLNQGGSQGGQASPASTGGHMFGTFFA